MNFVLVALGKIPEYLDDCISQIKKTQNITVKNVTIHALIKRILKSTN